MKERATMSTTAAREQVLNLIGDSVAAIATASLALSRSERLAEVQAQFRELSEALDSLGLQSAIRWESFSSVDMNPQDASGTIVEFVDAVLLNPAFLIAGDEANATFQAGISEDDIADGPVRMLAELVAALDLRTELRCPAPEIAELALTFAGHQVVKIVARARRLDFAIDLNRARSALAHIAAVSRRFFPDDPGDLPLGITELSGELRLTVAAGSDSHLDLFASAPGGLALACPPFALRLAPSKRLLGLEADADTGAVRIATDVGAVEARLPAQLLTGETGTFAVELTALTGTLEGKPSDRGVTLRVLPETATLSHDGRRIGELRWNREAGVTFSPARAGGVLVAVPDLDLNVNQHDLRVRGRLQTESDGIRVVDGDLRLTSGARVLEVPAGHELPGVCR